MILSLFRYVIKWIYRGYGKGCGGCLCHKNSREIHLREDPHPDPAVIHHRSGGIRLRRSSPPLIIQPEEIVQMQVQMQHQQPTDSLVLKKELSQAAVAGGDKEKKISLSSSTMGNVITPLAELSVAAEAAAVGSPPTVKPPEWVPMVVSRKEDDIAKKEEEEKLLRREIEMEVKQRAEMYLACVFHDLRGSLNNIVLGLQYLQETRNNREEPRTCITADVPAVVGPFDLSSHSTSDKSANSNHNSNNSSRVSGSNSSRRWSNYPHEVENRTIEEILENCTYISHSLNGFLKVAGLNDGQDDEDDEDDEDDGRDEAADQGHILQLKPVHLKTFFKKIISLVRFPCLEKKNRISLCIHPRIRLLSSWFLMDEMHLQHVLLNLLSNAIKFSTEGSIIFIDVDEANTHIRPPSTNVVLLEIRIKDDNAYIPLSVKSRLFEKRNTISNSRSSLNTPIRGVTSLDSGQGLGLYICKKIIEMHSLGQIHHSYVPGGHGNCFTLSWECPVIRGKTS
jgi:signal transduction histidine kinase